MTMTRFIRPPLSEVVFGVGFNAQEFSSVDFGLYWREIEERFPTPIDKQPVERLPNGGFEVSFMPLPPLRRVWFESSDKIKIVQLQENRFYYNWRRQDGTDKYPHFELIRQEFVSEWEYFQKWWSKKARKSPIQPINYELTYLNQIDKELGWFDTSDHQKIFTFTGRKWDDFLSKPEVHNSELAFLLPEENGHLSVRMNQQTRLTDSSNVILFELTAHSKDRPNPDSDLIGWFNIAHEYIVKAFLDLTQQSIHQEWGRNDN